MSKNKAVQPESATVEGVYTRIATTDLRFDHKNPRLIEYLDQEPATQDNLLRILWEEMAVDEIAMSVAASGYFEHEPLFVAREDKQNIVIEGNRRLAAVRLLLDHSSRKKLHATDLPSLSAADKHKLESLPVIQTTREKAWQYLGFKHVNGPAKWESYSKASYIAQVHIEYEVPLDEIAQQIGDKHQTVQRLFRALMVINQAEKFQVFDRANRFKGHFSFSHLYTGLDYDGFAAFISLKDESMESPKPVPPKWKKELGELCTWLYGDKALDIQPVVQSQNPHLRQLNAVLQDQKAVDSLRAGLPLNVALEVSYGDERVFHNALIQAKEALQKARATLSTGFDGDKEMLKLGNQISDLAYDLSEEMERKSSGRRRRR